MADIYAQAPDGTYMQFPDGTKPEVIQGAVKKYIASKTPPVTPPAPKAAVAPTRQAVDKFRMDFFNTNNPDANIPMKAAHALAKNPKDPVWLSQVSKMNPVSQQAIQEKAAELADEQRFQPVTNIFTPPVFVDPKTQQVGRSPQPSDVAALMIHGPEGAAQLAKRKGAVAEAERLALSSADPEQLAFLAAGGAIVSMGKVGKAAFSIGAAGVGLKQGAEKIKQGDPGGGAVDIALGLAPAAFHGAKKLIEIPKDIADVKALEKAKTAKVARESLKKKADYIASQKPSGAPQLPSGDTAVEPFVVSEKVYRNLKEQRVAEQRAEAARKKGQAALPAPSEPTFVTDASGRTVKVRGVEPVSPDVTVPDAETAPRGLPKPPEPTYAVDRQGNVIPASEIAGEPPKALPAPPEGMKPDAMTGEFPRPDRFSIVEDKVPARESVTTSDVPVEPVMPEVQPEAPAPRKGSGKVSKTRGALNLGGPGAPGSPQERFGEVVKDMVEEARRLGHTAPDTFAQWMKTQHGISEGTSRNIYNNLILPTGAAPISTRTPAQQAADSKRRRGPILPVEPAPGAVRPADPGVGTGRYAQVAKYSQTLMHDTHALKNATNIAETEAEIAHNNVTRGLSDTQQQELARYLAGTELYRRNPLHPQAVNPTDAAAIRSDPAIDAAINRHVAEYANVAEASRQAGVDPAAMASKHNEFISLIPPKEVTGSSTGSLGGNVASKLRLKSTRFAGRGTGGAAEYEMSDLKHMYQEKWKQTLPHALKNEWYRHANEMGFVKDTPDPGWERAASLEPTRKGTVYVPKDLANALQDAVGISDPSLKADIIRPEGRGLGKINWSEAMTRAPKALQSANVGLRLGLNVAEVTTHMRSRAALLRGVWSHDRGIVQNIVESIPLIGEAAEGVKMWNLDASKPEIQQVMKDIAYSGQGSSRPFRRGESNIPIVGKWQHAVHETLFGLPDGKGFKGWDWRMQIAAELSRRAAEGNVDPARIREFGAQFNQYSASPTMMAQYLSAIDPFIKTRGPRMVTSVKQFMGMSGLKASSTPQAVKFASQQIIRRIGGLAVAGITLNKTLSGHYPWQNAKGHQHQVQVTSGDNPLYLDYRAIEPMVSTPMMLSSLAEWSKQQTWKETPRIKHSGAGELAAMGAANVGYETISSPLAESGMEATFGFVPLMHRTKVAPGIVPTQITPTGSNTKERMKQAAIHMVGPSRMFSSTEDNPTVPHGLGYNIFNYLTSNSLKKEPSRAELEKLKRERAQEVLRANE